MPLLVIILTGVWLNKRLERHKSRLQMDHAIIQKRAEIYAGIQDDINKIYSYIKRVGFWKEYSPECVLQSKRLVDQKIHSTKPYWSKNTIVDYQKFMAACFHTYRGHGTDAGIRTDIEQYKTLPNWQDAYKDSFASIFDLAQVNVCYDNLMAAFSKDFGIE